jgi:hypothetical protein
MCSLSRVCKQLNNLLDAHLSKRGGLSEGHAHPVSGSKQLVILIGLNTMATLTDHQVLHPQH